MNTPPDPIIKTNITSTGLNLKCIGKKYSGKVINIKSEEIIAFAKATNDTNLYYGDKNKLQDGIVAPPLFPVKLFRDIFFEVLLDKEVGANLLRLVHGFQEFKFYRLLKPKDIFVSNAEILSIEQKNNGDLLTVCFKGYVEENLTVEGISGFFIRGTEIKKDKITNSVAAEDDNKDFLFNFPIEVTSDQPYRYAKASGDNNPIHTDINTAKKAGFKDVILQGLCTMAFTSQAVVQKLLSGNPEGFKKLSVRFSKPVFPGDQIVISGFLIQKETAITRIGLEARNQLGDKIITQGYAEIKN